MRGRKVGCLPASSQAMKSPKPNLWTSLLEGLLYDLENEKKRSKHGFFVFPPKKTLIWRRHSLTGQSYYGMTSRRSIGCFLGKFSDMTLFSPQRSLNPPKATRVCIRSINQSNRPISGRLLFLFCSRVFILRSYENRSMLSIVKLVSQVQASVY